MNLSNKTGVQGKVHNKAVKTQTKIVKISKPTVFLMLSGGVDSSVSAYILKQMGFKVIGVYMLRWWAPELGPNCPANEDLEYVFKVGRQLGIPVYIADFREQYQKQVLSQILQGFESGLTPNPDTLCNRHIKFKAFVNFVQKIYKKEFLIATGHYASTFNRYFLQGADLHNLGLDNLSENKLYIPLDSYKDQTYFLYDINKNIIQKTIFPLGFLIKPQVRKIAEQIGLATSKRQDSTGVCFIGNIELGEFLKDKLGVKKGPIIDIETNKQVGGHLGLWFYTIGQRKGLGIGGVSPAYYVVSKDYDKNILYVAKGRFTKSIFTETIDFDEFNILDDSLIRTQNDNLKGSILSNVGALIRYRSNPYVVDLDLTKNRAVYKDIFDHTTIKDDRELQGFWAVAPGQSIVFYSRPYKKISYDVILNRVNALTGEVTANNVIDIYTNKNIVRNMLQLLAEYYRDTYVLGGAIIK